MFSAKIILLSGTLPLGAWQAWTLLDQSHLLIRVVFAVVASFGIFMAILAATEYATVARGNRAATPRAPAVFAHARTDLRYSLQGFSTVLGATAHRRDGIKSAS